MKESFSSEKIINKEYYISLLQKFTEDVEFNSSLLPTSRFNKINLSFIRKALSKTTGFDIIIKVPYHYYEILDEIYSNVYLFIANTQFYENYINPEFNIGDLLLLRNTKKIRKFKVIDITERTIKLLEQKREGLNDLNSPAKCEEQRKNIIKHFIPIKRPLNRASLNNYFNLFSSLYNLNIKEDYIPTKFDTVTVFVGSKKMFENFRNNNIHNGNLYNSIPCYYINRDGDKSDTLGIEPLIFFTSSYNLAYEQIIKEDENRKKVKVSNIVLFNDGFDELQQIINDQSIYGFRIIGICTTPIEKRASTIKYWEWNKEEINLLDSL